MSLTFRNIRGQHHYLLKYHGITDSVEIICFASPHYRAGDTPQDAEIQNYDDFIRFQEFEAFATFAGSFRDQFPASKGPFGHHPHREVVSWSNFVDMNSIQLCASRSLDDGSSTIRIPTRILRISRGFEHMGVIVRWQIQNRILTLVKGGGLLVEVPISRLEDCIRDGRLAAGRIENDQSCVGNIRCCSAS
jgi:hypothetical protein